MILFTDELCPTRLYFNLIGLVCSSIEFEPQSISLFETSSMKGCFEFGSTIFLGGIYGFLDDDAELSSSSCWLDRFKLFVDFLLK